MSVITCLTWVSRGYAKAKPETAQVNAEDIEEIKADMDMDSYDEEPDDPMFSNAMYEPLLEDLPADSDEDDAINPDDALLAVGAQKGDFSEIQVYIYEEQTSNLYVHHDFMLGAYPLSVSWIPYNPSDTSVLGNCVLVTSFLPEIEIWNLDELDPLEPIRTLGGVKRVEGKSGKKRKRTKVYKKGSHHDAVICSGLHPSRKNILATGSADKKVNVWDIVEGKHKVSLTHHKDKVQALMWNPQEEKILATAGISGFLHVVSADSSTTGLVTSVPSEIESLSWNPFSSNEVTISTEDGYVNSYDVRNFAQPLLSIQAHEKACKVEYSPGVPNLVATASADHTVRLWDAQGMQHVAERDMHVGGLFALQFYKDSPFILACGGTDGKLGIWDTAENGIVADRFSSN